MFINFIKKTKKRDHYKCSLSDILIPIPISALWYWYDLILLTQYTTLTICGPPIIKYLISTGIYVLCRPSYMWGSHLSYLHDSSGFSHITCKEDTYMHKYSWFPCLSNIIFNFLFFPLDKVPWNFTNHCYY